VMEYVPGVNLKQLLAAGPMPAGPALELMEEVADALYTAYERPGPEGEPLHLMHRDIKPSNIHLMPSGEVKILDFGVARADFQQRESVTQSFFFGSLAYMAPERLDGIDTHAGDVYALGSVLFELLTGTSIGRTSGHLERHTTILNGSMERLRARLADSELEDVLRRAMAYEPEERPTARQLTRMLRGLRSVHREPWLRDWAEDVVPDLCKRQDFVADELSGAILVEQGGDDEPDSQVSMAWSEGAIPPRMAGETWIQELVQGDGMPDPGEPEAETMLEEQPTELPTDELQGVEVTELAVDVSGSFKPGIEDSVRATPARMGAVAALLGGVVLVLVLVVGWVTLEIIGDQKAQTTADEALRSDATESDAKPSSSRTDQTEDGSAEAGVESEGNHPDAYDAPLKPDQDFEFRSVDASVDSAPEGAIVAPQDVSELAPPAPAPVIKAEGKVLSSGALIELQSGGVSYSAGMVPEGTYDIWAYFDGPHAAAQRAGEVTVTAGDEIMLRCAAKLCVPVSVP